MASAFITSAKHGAYLAIGLYVVLVLAVSLSPQSRQPVEAPIQVAHPGIHFEYHPQSSMVDQAETAGVAGA
ncbi:hypothetical protein ACYZTX_17950 [Pseudomonas sp. MDT1-17]